MKFCEIRILTDENISPKVVSFLRERGIDVIDTKEKNWHGKEDEEILEIAYKEKRFVLTHDSDFGTLAINEGKGNYGIVYLRLRNVNPRNVIKVYEQLLGLDTSISPGTILVIEETRIRIKYSEKNDN
ncbi:MAG: DUF5615 family PIN-like protein [Candidatus Brocadiaceae bacterium]|nr:DUF5615 family PIN-like protein [Candidatus Brocadiaceae bacterium]